MQNNPIKGVLFETFSVEEEDVTAFWPPREDSSRGASDAAAARGKKIFELVPNGANIDVTDANKGEYIDAKVECLTQDRASNPNPNPNPERSNGSHKTEPPSRQVRSVKASGRFVPRWTRSSRFSPSLSWNDSCAVLLR